MPVAAHGSPNQRASNLSMRGIKGAPPAPSPAAVSPGLVNTGLFASMPWPARWFTPLVWLVGRTPAVVSARGGGSTPTGQGLQGPGPELMPLPGQLPHPQQQQQGRRRKMRRGLPVKREAPPALQLPLYQGALRAL